MYGAGFGLLALAIYCLFFGESGRLRVISGAYLLFFFVVCIIDAFQRPEPLTYLVVPGLMALLMTFAWSIRRDWKNWP